jgi:hypothetical protein
MKSQTTKHKYQTNNNDQNSELRPCVLVVENWNLRFMCILVLENWDLLILVINKGMLQKQKIYSTTYEAEKPLP